MKQALVCMAAAVALSMACEYDDLDEDALILISDSHYCHEVCVVDRACKKQNNSTFNRIGYFMDYPQHSSGYTKLSFDGDNEVIDLSNFALPDYISELSFINFPTVKLLGDFEWPAQLSKLTFQEVDEIDISSNVKWPREIAELSILSCAISTLPAFPRSLKKLWLNSTAVPDSQSFEPLPPSLTFLSLAQNEIDELANLDWRQLSTLILSDSPALHVISNVLLSSKLENLTLNNLNLVSWTMDKPTYDAVSKLQAATPNKSNGYEAKSLQINSNSCNLANRTTLWGKTTAAVCVLPDTSFTKLPPSATSPFVSTLPPTTTGTPTQPSTTTPVLTETSSNVVITVGITLGAALMLGGSVACLVLRRRRKSHETNSSVTTHPGYNPIATPRRLQLVNASKFPCYDLNTITFGFMHVLSTGGCSNVYKGTLHDRDVAVKALVVSSAKTVDQIQSFSDEIDLMSTFKSPFVVAFLGPGKTKQGDLMYFMELMTGGDLRTYLDNNSVATVPWKIKCGHILDIACGLEYLHSKSVIHRDLKARNVLLDPLKRTKLTGLGNPNETFEMAMTKDVDAFRWMAPEVLQGYGFTTAADIYSFGMLLSEIDTHDIPYNDMVYRPSRHQSIKDTAIFAALVSGRLKPTFTETMPLLVSEPY
ncbi:TKL protein kinase [Aphanomyces invadans]|uniref:TKL protein kinase n=1 Tax=Aphanomyces invadans TaxID=157072 RepID=A0A024TAY2_9STRA|nr:TKL protein kinase [Aphanomyces invadans]ETV90771.1 TKL protein kinase [Aphanomyces invadans]|eukprot:XP_008880607.1 TKL protein kinase [Aphanomyces invadans]